MTGVVKIVSLYKSGPSDNPGNYRPISILPIFSKILERAIHRQMSAFLEDRKLISEFQFGYRKNMSTELATTLLLDNIRREVDDKKLVGAIFVDLSKAFDTVSHSILLAKLTAYGVRDVELEWFKNYLFARYQRVSINNENSDDFPLLCGVPQGSILGPLLFTLFFNDLPDHLRSAKVIKYADDTVFYFASGDFDVIESTLNNEMMVLSSFCDQNELVLNLKKGKTESMMFGTAKRLSSNDRDLGILSKDVRINNTSAYKYLGSLLDPTLTLSHNFDTAYRKASGRIRLLAKLQLSLTPEACFKVYTMMILPLLTYSSLIMLAPTSTQARKYDSIERRASEIINSNDTNARYRIPKTISVIKKNACVV